ncbi:hypothetical protein [Streptomyces sp. HNM0574]|uniref:hypothetical protein n=1 Tax=Streptomyces sp. HNM0574 TaxID=2714954 RepID=UPI00146C5DE8|nr:hypothetical protein [Streptomyces sp. HNM0574]NLU68680.1 hypothetical protein [Streptomyces sp. HNM0574]
MADIIDPAQHASLVALQTAADDAFTALDAHTREVGKPGAEWTDEEKQRAEELREAVRQAVGAKDEALAESGLAGEHGWYLAGQALKAAARESAEQAG